MTLAEINRAIESRNRILKAQAQERAAYDYTLAELIGRSVARVYNSQNTFPTLADAYPSLFSKEAEQEKIQQNKDEMSAIRFKQFAQLYNKKYQEVAKNK